MKIAGYVLIAGLSAMFFVLAAQAEPVTATLGYICGGLMAGSLLASLAKQFRKG